MALVTTPKAENALTAVNDVGDSIRPRGHFTVSIQGTFTGQVNLMRKVAGGTAGLVKTYEAAAEEQGFEPASDFEYYFEASLTSGTANTIIGDQFI